jgi:hypothetical protein
MRILLLSAIATLALVHSASAAGRPKPAYDPIHDPNLSPSETDLYVGYAALATIVTTGCTNVPWQVSSNFQKGLQHWREAFMAPARSDFILDKVSTEHARVPCDKVLDTFAQISKNWLGQH